MFGAFNSEENGSGPDGSSTDLISVDGKVVSGQSFLDEVGLDIARRVAPTSVTFHDDYMQTGDFFLRTLYISSYPTQVDVGWLQTIYQYQEALDVSLFIQPLSSPSILKRLRTKVARETAQIQQDFESGAARDFEREKRLEDSLALQEALERDETKPFQVSLVITVKARSKDELDIITDAIERKMDGIQAKTRRAARRQKDGLLSVLPVGKNYLKDAYSTRNMQTHAVQTMFPLTSSDISHETGVLYGVNMSTHSNVILDRFKLDNPNLIVLGQSGAGKSFTAKMELIRWLMHGVPVTIIDPQNEYQRLCEALGGQFISISVNSKYKINPLDFSHAVYPGKDVLTEKILNVMKLLGSMLSEGGNEDVTRGLDAEQRAILDEVLLELYQSYGYTNDPASQAAATAKKMPLLSDLHDLMMEKLNLYADNPNYQAKVSGITAVLRRYIRKGTLAGLFDQHTNVDLRSNLVVFNVQGLDKDLVGVGMHGILEYVRTTMLTVEQLSSGSKKLIYIDEAHRLMKFKESAAFIEDLAKTVRKFNIGLTVLSQDPEDFLQNRDGTIRPEGVTIVRNCAMQLLLRQHKNGLPVISEVFGLTEAEADYLSRCERGEGMLFAQEEHAWMSMRNMASPMEYELITTNPEEVAIIAARQRSLQGHTPDTIAPVAIQQKTTAHLHAPQGAHDPVLDRTVQHSPQPTVRIERRREAKESPEVEPITQGEAPRATAPAFAVKQEPRSPQPEDFSDLPDDLFD